MKVTIPMTVTAGGLVPSNQHARELYTKFRVGDRVMISVFNRRNVRHHRLFWAMLSRVAECRGETAENLLLWLKVKMGRIDFKEMVDGTVVPHYHSISFERMDQTEFREFYEQAVALLFEHFVPDMPAEERERMFAMAA